MPSFAASLAIGFTMIALAAPMPGVGSMHADDACAAVDGGGEIMLDGKTYRDAPDLQDANLRAIHARLGDGRCRVLADEALARALSLRPDDPALQFLRARADALDGKTAQAEAALRRLAARPGAPDSATVLLAAIELDKEQRSAAGVRLQQARTRQPDDFRIAFLQMRLDALEQPKGDGAGRLLAVLRDRDAPPDVRESAQATLLYLTALDVGRKEAALRESLTFSSQTPHWAKAIRLGRLLAEEKGDTSEARDVLLPLIADPGAAAGHAQARVLLATTWLLDAAALDPAPGARNAVLVEKAWQAVGQDRLALARHVASWHQLSALRPFVAGIVDPDVRDADGMTALCRAAQALDERAVEQALRQGSAPDAECMGATPVAWVVRSGRDNFPRRRAVLTLLLESGADPDPRLYKGSSYGAIGFCADGYPDCERELLPLLSEHQAKREASMQAPTP